ncbi:hypothetical protein M5689_024547 [Euphorbia peplus]|nr:hypothetical protein M5689_024547 [Euphorbia peplus]
MDSTQSSQTTRGRGKNKKVWTFEEDRTLIECLQEVAADSRFKQDNTSKTGYLVRVEGLINQKLPMSCIRADPHIDSRWKTLKAKYNDISEMLNKSGFGWDDIEKMIQCEKMSMKNGHHKEAKGLWNTPFHFFDEIGELSGKDRATGKGVETFGDAVDNMEKEMNNETNIFSDEENEEDDSISVNQSKSTSRFKRARKQSKSKESKESQEPHMVAAFQNVSSNFNSFMESMNTHLSTMATAWSRLTPTEALQAADILTGEQNKLRVFYQAPPDLRRQYVLGLLHPRG